MLMNCSSSPCAAGSAETVEDDSSFQDEGPEKTPEQKAQIIAGLEKNEIFGG